MEKKLQKIRVALAEYIKSEGCSCCQNERTHAEAAEMLALLLDIPKYEDGSGYDFYKFCAPEDNK